VGNKTERILANGIKTSWQYNSRHQLTGLSHRQANGTLIADYQYTLDAKGNRTVVTESLVNEQGQSHQRQLAYSYDNVDRLTTETVTDNDNAFGGSYSRSYQYDSVGNRSQQSHTANNQTFTTTYSYDVNDQLQSETTSGVQTNYRYDKNGNLIEKYNAQGVLAQYRYNTQNQLIEVILPQVTYRYAYDSQGNRIQSQQLKNGQTDTKHYLVDTNFNYAEVIEEKDGQGQLLASHSFAPENTGDLLSVTNSNKESRYTLEDGLGSLRQITNTLGQVQGSQATTAWGENLNNTTKIYTDYGYTGEKQNTETGLVYLRAREYMPSVGRFVQRDTWAGIPTKPVTLNQFVYADANGVNKKDPSGRFTLGQYAIAANVGLTSYFITTNILNENYSGVAVDVVLGFMGAGVVKLGGFGAGWYTRNQKIRQIYHNLIVNIENTIPQLRAAGKTSQQIAEQVTLMRNSAKIEARAHMTPKDLALVEARNIKEYQDPIGPTALQLFEKKGSWEAVIESSTHPNVLVDFFFCIK
jgi:RHS repeat-associated protein